MFEELKSQFILNFITDNRWLLLINGLVVTLKITFFAVILGFILGFGVAVVRNIYDNTKKLPLQYLYYSNQRDTCSCSAPYNILCYIQFCKNR